MAGGRGGWREERCILVELPSRIQLSLAFSVPDYTLRMDIWKSHVPGA